MSTRTDPAALLRRIRESVIGDGYELPGPYGPRRITYADHTASGRSLSSGTGRATTRLREEARRLILDAVGFPRCPAAARLPVRSP